MSRKKVFISYSRQDEAWLKRLKVHLKFLEREHQFVIWDDSQIAAGASWKTEIEQAMADAKIALILVSAHYIASDFISTQELPPLLHAAQNEGAHILPIILSPCMFTEVASLADFQSINDPGQPLSVMTESQQETVFVSVTQTLMHVLSASYSGRKLQKSQGPNDRLQRKYELSVARVRIMQLFRADGSENGLTVSEAYQTAKIAKRKDVRQIMEELVALQMVEKNRPDKTTYYKLKAAGKKFIDRVGEPLR